MSAARIGNWLFAAHPSFTGRPVLDRSPLHWSLWWLWFEIARAAPAEKMGGS